MSSERLKQLRIEKNMTQSDLAKLLQVSPSTIGMYEQGRRDPDTKTLIFLADYFDVTVDYLLGRTDDKEIRVYEKDQIPEKFRSLGLEYIELAKEMKLNDISVEEMKAFIEFMRKTKKKEQE